MPFVCTQRIYGVRGAHGMRLQVAGRLLQNGKRASNAEIDKVQCTGYDVSGLYKVKIIKTKKSFILSECATGMGVGPFLLI